MAAVHPSRMGLVQASTRPPAASSEASREDILKRQLLERRQARTPVAPLNAGSISIKGKGKGVASDERRGMRAWSDEDGSSKELRSSPRPEPNATVASTPRQNGECPQQASGSGASVQGTSRPHNVRDEAGRRDMETGREHSRPPTRYREASHDSSLAYPRTRSPTPNRSPRGEPRHRPAEAFPRRTDERTPPPAARRIQENPERRAMREHHALPPRPHGNPERVQAAPMRGADPGYGRDRRGSPSYPTYDRPPHQVAQPVGGGSNGHAAYGYGGGRRDLPGQAGPGQPSQDSGTAPWRDPKQGGWQNLPRRNYGPVDFEQRRLQRENSTLVIWPPSPKQPYKDEEELEAERRAAKKAAKAKASKKSKRRSRYSSASSSGSDSGEEEKRIRRRRKEKRRRRYSTSGSDPDDRDASQREVARKKRQDRASDVDDSAVRDARSESRSGLRSPGHVVVAPGVDDEWIEKNDKVTTSGQPLSLEDLARIQQRREEEEAEIGPSMPNDHSKSQLRHRYEDMLPGEAEAMMLYASNGLRIPRRGEIGLDTDRIQTFEEAGYVMSGARHKKMNAVRLRKENQVINAEEKRAILNLQREEKMKREGMIVSQFRELMNSSLQQHQAGK